MAGRQEDKREGHWHPMPGQFRPLGRVQKRQCALRDAVDDVRFWPGPPPAPAGPHSCRSPSARVAAAVKPTPRHTRPI